MEQKSGKGKTAGQRALRDLTPRREPELIKGGLISGMSLSSGGDRPTESMTF